MNRLKNFLTELAELTEKYGLSIGACGCCGSPWIVDLKLDETVADGLSYDAKEKKYTAYSTDRKFNLMGEVEE